VRYCAPQAGTPLNHTRPPPCHLAHAIAIRMAADLRPFIVHGGSRLFSIVIVFGVATLCATALLFVLQMYEDLTRA